MGIKLITNEKNELEAEISDIDVSLLTAIVEKLNETGNVEFAAYKTEHPVLGHPKLIVKTKGSAKAADAVVKALDELKDETEEFKKKFSEMLK
jgi:DNA-directed RNA polymerase subunit L